ncbi:MAG: hypothetical protein Kow0025_25540 [Thermodesulfovibrionales bacterium]
MNRFFQFVERFMEENRTAIVLLLLLVAVMGGIAGLRYYRYTREDPQFCAQCHMMQESFRSWEQSSHRDIICQQCHRLSLLEQNRLFVKYVTQGYTEPRGDSEHGRVEPWNACRDCHMKEAKQGSVSLRSSFGHARHVFMEGIDCSRCHSERLHNFTPDDHACSSCHTDKLVHGMGMEGLSCLNCHSYAEESPKMVSPARCRECHKKMPTEGPMSGLACFQCHKPHGEIKLRSADCMGNCHGGEARVGQHGLHLEKAGLECLDCHKAHTWVVGEAQARGLCDRCHSLKDPKSFIY